MVLGMTGVPFVTETETNIALVVAAKTPEFAISTLK
jgi:hypothetical protein